MGYSIACEKCGVVQEGTELLVLHLRNTHGMILPQAVSLAKEMRERKSSADERVRRAGPELLDACEQLRAALISAFAGRPVRNADEIIAAADAAIEKARGE